MRGYITLYERILISTFHGNPATSIIIIYSPTNSSEDEVINKFYDDHRRAIENKMRTKWRNSITNVEAYSTFSSIGSDHRIVSSKVRLSLRANRKKLPRKLRYNWH